MVAPPYPSTSASAYQVDASTASSSIVPSQSSSTPLQASDAPGLTAAFPSSQSLESAVYPLGALLAVVALGAPQPSAAASADYQVPSPA